MTPTSSNHLHRWIDAIRTALPTADTDTIEFVANEIIESGIDTERDAGEFNEAEQEDALDSVIAEHLQTLLGIHQQETGFISRDILDAYLYPTPIPSADEETSTRPDRCELCDRPMFLTIHHLFPRSEHTFLLRHPPSNLPQDFPFTKSDLLVTHRAWLCRPCHSAVHRIKSNRELGMEFWSVERLLEVEEIRKWVGYVGKQRASGKNHGKLGIRYKR